MTQRYHAVNPFLVVEGAHGSSDGTPATEIARRLVEYLEGGRVEAAGRTPGRVVELPSPSDGTAA